MTPCHTESVPCSDSGKPRDEDRLQDFPRWDDCPRIIDGTSNAGGEVTRAMRGGNRDNTYTAEIQHL